MTRSPRSVLPSLYRTRRTIETYGVEVTHAIVHPASDEIVYVTGAELARAGGVAA